MFPKQITCVCCGATFPWGDERLATFNHAIYWKAAPARPLNPGEGIRVCMECFAEVLAMPAGDKACRWFAALVEVVTANYKKITTAPETPLQPLSDCGAGDLA